MKKSMLKVFALTALVGAGIGALAGCNKSAGTKVKLGLILLHPAADSTYDRNFYDAVKAYAATDSNFDYTVRDNIPENDPQITTTADALADGGCDIVFADSFGHESNLIESAKTHKDVIYCHATGYQASTCGYDNFYNAFASIYEGRYLTGVAAGKKLEAMIAANPSTAHKVGYVGAFPFDEVRSGFTAWYLGVKSVVSDVTMTVRYAGSWFDPTAETNLATTLIENDNCAIISQHADSYGAPTACESKGVPNVSYNYSTEAQGPTTYLTASKIDWSAYIKHVVEAVRTAKETNAKATTSTQKVKPQVTQDFVGTLKNGGVKVLDCSKNCPAGTQDFVNQKAAQLNAGTLNVFDTNSFTVKGEKQTSYKKNGKEVIVNGVFQESRSDVASAPYFPWIIDGITSIEN